MVKSAVSSSETRSREATPKVSTKEPERQREKVVEKEVRGKAEVVKKPVSKPMPTPTPAPVETEQESIPETPLPSQPTPTPTGSQAEIEIPTPETPLTPPPATLAPELPERSSTELPHPASSPARSIYSQMTSDSEDDDEARPGQETEAVLRRLGEMKSKASSKAVSVKVKKELIEGSVREEGRKRKMGTPGPASASTRKEEAPTAAATKPPVQLATPLPVVPATSEKTEDPTSTPQPPADLDLQALVATSVVFSGVSAISAFDLVKTILDSQPSMRTLGSDAVWTTWIGDVLRGKEMFGRVDRKGKVSARRFLVHTFRDGDADQTS